MGQQITHTCEHLCCVSADAGNHDVRHRHFHGAGNGHYPAREFARFFPPLDSDYHRRGRECVDYVDGPHPKHGIVAIISGRIFNCGGGGVALKAKKKITGSQLISLIEEAGDDGEESAQAIEILMRNQESIFYNLRVRDR